MNRTNHAPIYFTVPILMRMYIAMLPIINPNTNATSTFTIESSLCVNDASFTLAFRLMTILAEHRLSFSSTPLFPLATHRIRLSHDTTASPSEENRNCDMYRYDNNSPNIFSYYRLLSIINLSRRDNPFVQGLIISSSYQVPLWSLRSCIISSHFIGALYARPIAIESIESQI